MMERLELIAEIDAMVKRSIVLCNHIGEDCKPKSGYVREKMKSLPGLDTSNKVLYNKIAEMLKSKFGVDLNDAYKWYTRGVDE